MTENTYQFYYKTQDAWLAMYEDCRAAKKSIEFEQYILKDDEAGRKFLDLFAAKARAGIKVRLLLDSVGSRSVDTSALIKKIHDAGGDVRFYNPMSLINLFIPSSWCPRNHAKTLLIDESIGYIGSVCVSADMSDWYDLHMRFTGRLTDDVRKEFAVTSPQKPYIQPPHADLPFRYVVSRPHFGRNPFYHELLQRIRTAQESIYLVTPYFLPPWRLRHALYHAARRGVNVCIMISEKTDVRMADFVTRSYFTSLLDHSLRIFLYKNGMLHAKYAVIDDDWATIGSSNMDYLSLLSNREANIIIADAGVVAEIKQHFEEDIRDCNEVTFEYCRRITLYERLMGWVGRPIKRML